jgi:hypothetical protein
MGSNVTPKVVLLPASPDAPDTAPPQSPWRLAAKRFGVILLALAPLILQAIYDQYKQGNLPIPHEWAPWIGVGIAIVLSVMKAKKEQERKDAAAELVANGLPVGRALPADTVRKALYTPLTLHDA